MTYQDFKKLFEALEKDPVFQKIRDKINRQYKRRISPPFGKKRKLY